MTVFHKKYMSTFVDSDSVYFTYEESYSLDKKFDDADLDIGNLRVADQVGSTSVCTSGNSCILLLNRL